MLASGYVGGWWVGDLANRVAPPTVSAVHIANARDVTARQTSAGMAFAFNQGLTTEVQGRRHHIMIAWPINYTFYPTVCVVAQLQCNGNGLSRCTQNVFT